ncbi:helix-turn-helix domain-containing protein [Providencia manganoxydans]|uniref:helix-turn-helix domain-containing protein n=1 Tax=Providencia manganoxydans TaxID=2923283 RepID=UPI0029BFF078|nr:helix-turn-helix transcriptional regulator [Providencia manganoxydans]MDX4945440.1 helix-turn-helix transcriptional regulator [Providencia manganoxydans]
MENNPNNEGLQITKKHLSQAIGRQIYLTRKSRGLTGKLLADKLGVSQQQISRYERGVCRIDVDALICLLNQLDEPLDNFFHNVSIILKEHSPKVYQEYHALFFPVLALSNDQYILMKTGHYIN